MSLQCRIASLPDLATFIEPVSMMEPGRRRASTIRRKVEPARSPRGLGLRRFRVAATGFVG